MKFEELVEIVADEAVFETGLLLAGNVDASNLRRQLSRWTRAGRLLQMRRGLYALAPPWQKRKPQPFLVANRLASGSYVSGFSALAFAQAIPEYVAEVTSCTGGRPCAYRTPLGRFSFRRLKPKLCFGYRQVALSGGQQAFLAEPEKALSGTRSRARYAPARLRPSHAVLSWKLHRRSLRSLGASSTKGARLVRPDLVPERSGMAAAQPGPVERRARAERVDGRGTGSANLARRDQAAASRTGLGTGGGRRAPLSGAAARCRSDRRG